MLPSSHTWPTDWRQLEAGGRSSDTVDAYLVIQLLAWVCSEEECRSLRCVWVGKKMGWEQMGTAVSRVRRVKIILYGVDRHKGACQPLQWCVLNRVWTQHSSVAQRRKIYYTLATEAAPIDQFIVALTRYWANIIKKCGLCPALCLFLLTVQTPLSESMCTPCKLYYPAKKIEYVKLYLHGFTGNKIFNSQ